MKVMLYCQHVLGIGHFFRSMRIAEALSRHEVLFVEGGAPLPGFTPPAHVQRAFLPPLMMDSAFKSIDPGGEDLETIKRQRRDLLMEYFEAFKPDVLVIELFPFGRKAFRFELIPMLEKIRGGFSSARVVCSLRDILVEKKDQVVYEGRVLETLNTYFDLLLIHSDPRLTALEETFERTADIRIPVHYTGFVVRRAPERKKRGPNKTVVASSGGGKVGAELLIAAMGAVSSIDDPHLRLRVFPGPFLEEADRSALTRLAEKDPRIAILPFSPDFLSELANADLSISMAGYNTCMDILSARVKAIVHPFPQNREQAMRAGKLEKLGLVTVLPRPDAATLSSAVQEALQTGPPHPEASLNLEGAENTAYTIEKYLSAFEQRGKLQRS